MQVTAGTRVGPYEILSLLGTGGMGEVYRARDTRLDRTVAIKFSAERFTDRFEQEARAVAALNHPNIVALYDVGENYLVTELVDGDSLRTAQLTARKAVDVAAQIADGLAAAHAAGIVHRDLKPENVMVTREGRAKILDFGIARQRAAAATSGTEATRTLPGVVMGTTAYMSPEQIRGQELDHRSDIFSFGIVLYELLTSRRAFTGDTGADVMTAILKQDPPELPASVPTGLREIVRHCLEKEPAARFQSAKDLAFALRSLSLDSSGAAAAVTTGRSRSKRVLLAASVLATAAVLIGWVAPRWRTERPLDLSNYRITPVAMEAVRESDPAWSPDGKVLVYSGGVSGTAQIFARGIDSAVADQITKEDANCLEPFWSPSGDRIFYLKREQLWSVSAVGGEPRKHLDNINAASLAKDGITLAVTRDSALLFGKLGGELTPYRKPPFDRDFRARAIAFSPDGKKVAVLFTVTNAVLGELWLVPWPPESGQPRRLFSNVPANAAIGSFDWMPDGRQLVFSMGQGDEAQLYAGDLDTGAYRKLTSGLVVQASPAVSPDGKRIAFTQFSADDDLYELSLDGSSMQPLLVTARSEACGRWAANGREYFYASNANGPMQIWTRSVEGSRPRPLAPGFIVEPDPTGRMAVAPAEDRIAVGASGMEHSIWVGRVGGGKAMRLDPDNPDHHNPSWSPDGNWIAYERVRPKVQLIKAPSGGGAPIVIAEPRSGEPGPTAVQWSPSGEWIAWSSQSLTLYSPDGKQSRALNASPRSVIAFSRDGKTLYASRRESPEQVAIEAYEIATGALRRIGGFPLSGLKSVRWIDMHPDGKRFLATVRTIGQDIVMLEGF